MASASEDVLEWSQFSARARADGQVAASAVSGVGSFRFCEIVSQPSSRRNIRPANSIARWHPLFGSNKKPGHLGVAGATPRLIMNTPSSTDSVLSDRRMTRRRSTKCKGRSAPFEISNTFEEFQMPGIWTLARTKRLILAALRVWELKQGIRD